MEVNKAYLSITGTKESDLINKDIFDAFPENPGLETNFLSANESLARLAECSIENRY